MISKEDIVEKVSALRQRFQKSAAWENSALEAADSMKETIAIAFKSKGDEGALEMIEVMMEKYGGGGAQLSGLTQLGEKHSLSVFLASVMSLQAQFLNLKRGSILQLDDGVTFPLTRLNQLFVRDCYVDLLDSDSTYRELKPNLLVTYVTGTPGTGKSCCGAIHMSQCLARGMTVILELRAPEAAFYKLKMGEPIITSSSSLAFGSELSDTEVCYFVDGGTPSAAFFQAKCWAYTSPRGLSLKALKTVHQHSHTLKMPLFSLDELLRVRETVELYRGSISEESVQYLFKLAGGSARIMMAEVGEVGLPTSNCETLLQWHILNPEELPAHRAGSNSPAEGNLRRFKHHRLQFASSYIAALVGRHQTLSIRRMCASFILSQHGNVDMAGAIGHQFERLVHATLPNVPKCGAKLKLKMLATGVEFSLQLPPSSPRLFTATSEIPNLARADCSVYLMPTSGSYPAIDCLMSRKLLFQITTSSSHTINREGVERLCNFLKADEAEFKAAHDALDGMITAGGAKRKRNLLSADLPLLVFVTPDTQYLNWKGLQMYTGGGPQVPFVDQAVMCFPTSWAANGFPTLEE